MSINCKYYHNLKLTSKKSKSVNISFKSRVGNTWPAGQMRLSKIKSAALEHIFIFNRMRPPKVNSVAKRTC